MGVAKMRGRLPIDYHLIRSGYAFSPMHLNLEVTHHCNLACHMCDLYGRKEEIESIRSRREKLDERFDVSLIEKICSSFSTLKPVLSFGGGEPLMHPRIAELVARAKRHGFVCTLTTNGTLLESHAASLVDAGLDNLVISIDGPEEIHDATRGVKGAFARARAGAWELAERMRRKGSSRPRLRINCTINSNNFSSLGSLVGVAEDFGAESLLFSHLWFWDSRAVEAHNRAVGDLCWVVAQNMDGVDLIQPEALNREIRKIKGSRTGLVIKFLPSLSEREVVCYYLRRTEPVKRFACRAAWLTASVMPDGEVIPCLDCSYGNLGVMSFGELWNGEKARAFRKRLRKCGMFPACVRCCGLYLF
jgi:MoaA/NifB/PqqE/SkfB family radical SAM enzyme